MFVIKTDTEQYIKRWVMNYGSMGFSSYTKDINEAQQFTEKQINFKQTRTQIPDWCEVVEI